jgi:uncharacterized RmlC-like cupin family protein
VAEPLRHIRPDAFVPGQATPGMRREEALSRPGLWSGVVHTEPGMTSGWHHHGDHDTIAYVVSGRFRADFGPGGRDTVDAQPGDF